MSLRFLLDANVPPALMTLIRQAGFSAEHVATVLPGSTPDAVIAAYAAERRACIITNDRDFLALRSEHAFPALVLLRTGNLRKRVLLPFFEARLPDLADALKAGEPLVELR